MVEQCWGNQVGGTSDGGTVLCNSGTVMVEQCWGNQVGGTVKH